MMRAMKDHPAPESFGRYQVIREIGWGGTGIVYEGFDPLVRRKVAIKSLFLKTIRDHEGLLKAAKSLEKEAKAAGRINHLGVVKLYDCHIAEESIFLVMEYVDGGSLRGFLENTDARPVGEVVGIMRGLCEALIEIHSAGVLHRDIKPENILMTKNHNPKISDFGISRFIDATTTMAKVPIGTPYYMSPEQWKGERVDVRTDIFSLGIVFYEMLTRFRPFTGENAYAIMHDCLETNPIEPRMLVSAIPEMLSQFVCKCLMKSPSERFGSASEMKAALDECVKESPDNNPAGNTRADKSDYDLAQQVARILKKSLETRNVRLLAAIISEDFYHPELELESERGREVIIELAQMVADAGYLESTSIFLEDMQVTIMENGTISLYPIDLSGDWGAVSVELILQKEDGLWRVITLNPDGM